MADDNESGPSSPPDPTELFERLARAQSDAMTGLFGQMIPPTGDEGAGGPQWASVVDQLQAMWKGFQAQQATGASESPMQFTDPAKWMATVESVVKQLPLSDPDRQKMLWEDGLALAETVLGHYGIGPKADNAAEEAPELPRSDRRFADPKWREQPFFALLHQAYLMLSEHVVAMAEDARGLEPGKQAQLAFAVRALVDALSPANFPMTNPVALDKAAETKGQSLIAGMEHLLADLKRGQLTQTPPDAFTVGEDLATTPGKVVHETPLFQLIQYLPSTDKVLKRRW